MNDERPNPIGPHEVVVLAVDETRTPVLDPKPVVGPKSGR